MLATGSGVVCVLYIALCVCCVLPCGVFDVMATGFSEVNPSLSVRLRRKWQITRNLVMSAILWIYQK